MGIEADFPEARADREHLGRIRASLDRQGHEGGKFGRRPACILWQLGVDDVETKEWVLGIRDAAEYVDAEIRAGMVSDGGIGIH